MEWEGKIENTRRKDLLEGYNCYLSFFGAPTQSCTVRACVTCVRYCTQPCGGRTRLIVRPLGADNPTPSDDRLSDRCPRRSGFTRWYNSTLVASSCSEDLPSPFVTREQVPAKFITTRLTNCLLDVKHGLTGSFELSAHIGLCSSIKNHSQCNILINKKSFRINLPLFFTVVSSNMFVSVL